MQIEWKTCLKVGVSAFLLYLAMRYWDGVSGLALMMLQAAAPLLLGCLIAYVVNILMSFYERHWPRSKRPLKAGARRSLCMLLAFVTVVAVVAALILLILPQLLSCFQVLLEAIPETIETIYAWLDREFGLSAVLASRNLSIPTTQAEWETMLTNYAEVLLSGVGGVMSVVISAATSVVGGVVTAFMALIFAVYLLSGKERLAGQFGRLSKWMVGERWTKKAQDVLSVMNDCFHSYIVGQCLEALILGGLCVLGMLLLRLPYAGMIGALVGVTALIPIAGAYIGGAIGAIMVFSVDPVNALIFLTFLIILQQIEGNLIYPKTVGSTLGLPALWVLAAVTVGGGVMGIVGMILFVPLTATVYRLLGRAVKTTPAE